MKISVLTEDFNPELSLSDYLVKLMRPKNISGHKAVTGSLLRGLANINVRHNYNPPVLLLSKNVVVLSGVQTLELAIKLKKEGHIKKLLAGPNIMVFADEYNGILSSQEIDRCLVPSQWVAHEYKKDNLQLKNRISIFFSGVDINFWNPIDQSKKNNILIYSKTDTSIASKVEESCRRNGYDTIRINYGQYTPGEFKSVLEKVKLAVFISRSESQGIALAESWAMDVPTFVWDIHESVLRSHHENRHVKGTSAAPYLCAETGLTWQKIDELETAIFNFFSRNTSFSPRKWVLNNMTDEVSAKKLTDIFKELS